MKIVNLLQNYLQINSSQPNPNYEEVINFFIKNANDDGFLSKKLILKSGLPMLIITLEGSNKELPSVCLNHHMDTVSAINENLWLHPPFSGFFDGINIYGRGAQDMKGVGIAHYMALRKIKMEKIQLKRTVHLLLVPDEEVGGYKGTKEFLETEEFKKLNIGFVLDEGIASGNNDFVYLKVSERKPIQIKLISSGQLAHGSKLHAYNALHELIKALNMFVEFQESQKIINSEHGLLISTHITSCKSGISQDGFISLNVIPEFAQATIDIRIPPEISIEQGHEFLENILINFPNIKYEVLAQSNEDYLFNYEQSSFYKNLKETILSKKLNVKNLFFEATTDLRFYLKQGIEGLGLTPFLCKENLHGINESITVNDLILAEEIFYSFLKKFCG